MNLVSLINCRVWLLFHTFILSFPSLHGFEPYFNLFKHWITLSSPSPFLYTKHKDFHMHSLLIIGPIWTNLKKIPSTNSLFLYLHFHIFSSLQWFITLQGKTLKNFTVFHKTFFQINLSFKMFNQRLKVFILATHFLIPSYIRVASFGDLNEPLFWEIYHFLSCVIECHKSGENVSIINKPFRLFSAFCFWKHALNSFFLMCK